MRKTGMTGGKPRVKVVTEAKLKKKLDAAVSVYIRAKYPKECYTCGNKNVRLQCGHFISRIYTAVRWDEDNLRPQCRVCNCLRQGMSVDFEEHLIKDIGEQRVEELKRKRHEVTRLSPAWYAIQIEMYKSLL